MKKATLEWISIAEGDWETANREIEVVKNTNLRAVSFHCQQCGEKYLKAFIQEQGFDPKRTYDLEILLNEVLTYEPNWSMLRESSIELTDFAVAHRYPGATSTREIALAAIIHAGRIRKTIREFFDLEKEPPTNMKNLDIG